MAPWWERRGKRFQSQRTAARPLWRRGTTPYRFYVHHKPKPKTKPISSGSMWRRDAKRESAATWKAMETCDVRRDRTEATSTTGAADGVVVRERRSGEGGLRGRRARTTLFGTATGYIHWTDFPSAIRSSLREHFITERSLFIIQIIKTTSIAVFVHLRSSFFRYQNKG